MSNTLTVRWSPHSDAARQRFVRINSRDHDLCYYDVVSSVCVKGNDLKFKQIARHAKVPYIRCFDWSPVDEDLIAVGQSSGEALLIRLSNPTSPSTPLAVKHQRSCNGISFNASGALLATGLDKVRNDFCLNIWDINARSASAVPARQLASSEAISAVKFTRDNDMTLLAGVAYRWLRMFDLRESPANPALSIHTRCTHGLSLDADPNYFAAHAEDGMVQVWDRRYARLNPASGEPALSFTRVTDEYGRGGSSGISSLRYSPCVAGTFAALNAGGGLRVYETAKITDPDSFAVAAIANLENGISDVHKPRAAGGGWRDSAANFLETGRGVYGGTSTSGTRTPSTRGVEPGEAMLVNRITDLASSSRSGKTDRRVASFDWMVEGRGKGGGSGGPLRILAIRNDGSLDIMSCPGPVSSMAWGSRNQFSITCERDLKIMPTPDPKSAAGSPRSPKKSLGSDGDGDGSDDEKYQYYAAGSPERLGLLEKRRTTRSTSVVNPSDFLPSPAAVLRNDICVTMRQRVEAGYQMDCAHNAKLAAAGENQYLEDMWVWLDGAAECARDNSMAAGALDLGFLGVAGIWGGGGGGDDATPESRYATGARPRKAEWTEACAVINRREKRRPFRSRETAFPEQRRLCLAICGWNYDAEDLESELQRLEANSQHAKAAGLALFNGDIDRAISSLQQGGQQLKLMSTAVAGYFSQNPHSLPPSHSLSPSPAPPTPSPANSTWKTLASEMATELYDPYLRAIFAYVSNSEWKDVLDEIGLPLRERIGIALRWLGDEQLTNFLAEATRNVVANGDLEGVMLTGVTERGVDLLQVYINRTADVQTAALVASWACPRYFRDERVEYWMESYRHLLNSWRLFHARARFDVARGKASRNRQGAMTMDAPQRQVYVRCANCDRSISHASARTSLLKKDPRTMTMREKQATATAGGVSTKPTVCPHCKKSLPRCAVCLLNLGTIYYKPGGEERAAEPERDYDRWFNFCLSCNHGMHAGHAKEWFAAHRVCPVPDCECTCKM
ncbi:hypothetical protein EDC01DRAFT_701985 [Geopyxis carbonaria]|nr:hypothetical protein EDC01DRAFT_701985 [Geopyxis carbonaria]